MGNVRLSDVKTRLVEIMPIEFRKGHWEFNKRRHKDVWKNPRLLVYWDFKIDPMPTKKDIEKIIISKRNLKKTAVAVENADGSIEYRYGKEPKIIILQKHPDKVFTTKADFEEFGKSKCQQQASIFLRLLREYEFAKFKQVSATFNPYRIGRTYEERKMVFEAAHNLFGDKTDK